MLFQYLHQVLRIRNFNENAHFHRWNFATWSDFFVLTHSHYVSVWPKIFFSLTFSMIKKIVPRDFQLFTPGVRNTQF